MAGNQTALVTSLALAEQLGIYDLILFLFGGDYSTLSLLTALGSVTIIICPSQRAKGLRGEKGGREMIRRDVRSDDLARDVSEAL